jgi:hypothetical protein
VDTGSGGGASMNPLASHRLFAYAPPARAIRALYVIERMRSETQWDSAAGSRPPSIHTTPARLRRIMARLLIVMKLPRRLTLLLLAALAGFGVSARAAEGTFRAQLVEPAQESTLVAGSIATISWDAKGIPGNFDEWEAFLSFDSGGSYPLRITPHLDLDIRSFTWRVPALPGSEGSVLLRFGNEREERRFAFASRFRIAGSLPLVSPLVSPSSAPIRTHCRGEAAEPDFEGVVAWAEGPRDGSSITQVTSADEALSPGQQPAVAAQRSTGATCATSPRGDRDGLRSNRDEEKISHARLKDPNLPHLDRSFDILLIIRRRNI